MTFRSFVDISVYSRNRCFRVAGSSKVGISRQSPRLLPNVALSRKPGLQGDAASVMRQCLVVPDLPAGAVLHVIELSESSAEPAPQATLNAAPVVAQVGGSSGSTATNARSVMAVVEKKKKQRLTAEQWMAKYDQVTPTPLMDLPFVMASAHPFIQASTRGIGRPGEPFEALTEWVLEVFRSWRPSAEGTAIDVLEWRYVRSEYPTEQLIHMTAKGVRHCFHRQREHLQQHVMISVDLIRHQAWQRCWDPDCSIAVEGAPCRLKAKHLIGRPPVSGMPVRSQLDKFEDARELVNR